MEDKVQNGPNDNLRFRSCNLETGIVSPIDSSHGTIGLCPEQSAFFLYPLFLLPTKTHLAVEVTEHSHMVCGSLGAHVAFSLCENKPNQGGKLQAHKLVNQFGQG